MYNLTPEQVAVLNEYGEADAWANYYLCAPPEVARQLRIRVNRVGHLCLTTVAEFDWTFFNRILGLGIREPATERMLDECIALIENSGCKNYMAQVAPGAQPSELPAWLESRGFVRGRSWAKFYRGNEPAPVVPTDLALRSIGQEYAGQFSDTVLAAFEMPAQLGPMIRGIVGAPGWYAYLAFDGEQPVSAAAMHVAGDVCWLGFGSTLESYRKRGGQGALFARRIGDGLKLGCKWFVTETGEDTPESPNPSYHNMVRAGFQLAYLRPNYIHQSAAE